VSAVDVSDNECVYYGTGSYSKCCKVHFAFWFKCVNYK